MSSLTVMSKRGKGKHQPSRTQEFRIRIPGQDDVTLQVSTDAVGMQCSADVPSVTQLEVDGHVKSANLIFPLKFGQAIVVRSRVNGEMQSVWRGTIQRGEGKLASLVKS